jgi:hypothetical protein
MAASYGYVTPKPPKVPANTGYGLLNPGTTLALAASGRVTPTNPYGFGGPESGLNSTLSPISSGAAPVPSASSPKASSPTAAPTTGYTPIGYSPAATPINTAPVAIPYDINTDPNVQNVTASTGMSDEQAQASALAQRQQQLLAYGDPALASAVLGASDPTVTAAGQNPSSTLAQLSQERGRNTKTLEDQLNAANLTFSGYRVTQETQAAQDYQNQLAQAAAAVNSNLGSIGTNLTSALGANQAQRTAAQQAAEAQANQVAIANAANAQNVALANAAAQNSADAQNTAAQNAADLQNAADAAAAAAAAAAAGGTGGSGGGPTPPDTTTTGGGGGGGGTSTLADALAALTAPAAAGGTMTGPAAGYDLLNPPPPPSSGARRGAVPNPFAPAPALSPNTAYGLLNPGTTIPASALALALAPKKKSGGRMIAV